MLGLFDLPPAPTDRDADDRAGRLVGAFRGVMKDSEQYRGDCPNFEPSRAVAPFAGPFLGPPEPFILDADRLARKTA